MGYINVRSLRTQYSSIHSSDQVIEIAELPKQTISSIVVEHLLHTYFSVTLSRKDGGLSSGGCLHRI